MLEEVLVLVDDCEVIDAAAGVLVDDCKVVDAVEVLVERVSYLTYGTVLARRHDVGLLTCLMVPNLSWRELACLISKTLQFRQRRLQRWLR